MVEHIKDHGALELSVGLAGSRLLVSGDQNSLFLRRLLDGGQQVIDRLVRMRGDADGLTLSDQGKYDPARRPGLSSPRRSLDEQVTVSEIGNRVDSIGNGIDCASQYELTKLTPHEPRWLAA